MKTKIVVAAAMLGWFSFGAAQESKTSKAEEEVPVVAPDHAAAYWKARLDLAEAQIELDKATQLVLADCRGRKIAAEGSSLICAK
jgi:hypothetical protein